MLLSAKIIFLKYFMLHPLFKSLTDCNTISHNGVYVIPPTDTVIGRLLQLGVSRCPELGKAWSQFASWCYRWGRRVVDAASEARGQLSEVDRVAVQQIMPPGISADDLDKVYFILSQTRGVADEEDIEVRSIMDKM
jgi:PI-3-kinase-related kinase SMG-1